MNNLDPLWAAVIVSVISAIIAFALVLVTAIYALETRQIRRQQEDERREKKRNIFIGLIHETKH